MAKTVCPLSLNMEDFMTEKDVTFIIKPEEKIIIGIYKIFMSDEESYICKINDEGLCAYKFNSYSYPFVNVYPKTIKAIARCQEPDEWNEEFGKKLVLAKLQLKYNYFMFNALYRLKNSLMKDIMGLENLLNKLYNKCSAIEIDIDYYFNNEGKNK